MGRHSSGIIYSHNMYKKSSITILNYNCKKFKAQATIMNYDHNTFIVYFSAGDVKFLSSSSNLSIIGNIRLGQKVSYWLIYQLV